MSKCEEFLAGDRLDDVAIYISADALSGSEDVVVDYGEPVDGGVVLVLPGDRGRNVFSAATGLDAMKFAQQAMDTPGTIEHDLTGGDCPSADIGKHELNIVFAFAEAQNEDVGGIYAEGDVVHAYAQCSCGDAYSDKWVVEP